jgi:hypothetical protein
MKIKLLWILLLSITSGAIAQSEDTPANSTESRNGKGSKENQAIFHFSLY